MQFVSDLRQVGGFVRVLLFFLGSFFFVFLCDGCRSFFLFTCPFYFGHCVVYPSIYGFRFGVFQLFLLCEIKGKYPEIKEKCHEIKGKCHEIKVQCHEIKGKCFEIKTNVKRSKDNVLRSKKNVLRSKENFQISHKGEYI